MLAAGGDLAELDIGRTESDQRIRATLAGRASQKGGALGFALRRATCASLGDQDAHSAARQRRAARVRMTRVPPAYVGDRRPGQSSSLADSGGACHRRCPTRSQSLVVTFFGTRLRALEQGVVFRSDGRIFHVFKLFPRSPVCPLPYLPVRISIVLFERFVAASRRSKGFCSLLRCIFEATSHAAGSAPTRNLGTYPAMVSCVRNGHFSLHIGLHEGSLSIGRVNMFTVTPEPCDRPSLCTRWRNRPPKVFGRGANPPAPANNKNH